ncbi:MULTISPECIES: hypothetical protein [Methanobacterium]|uniref:Uncharacterized protein n=1 Tax=Methanobacterium veterum TaxID=408577 RepID=A0A9E5A6T2_9EURY|nr:MULTISPECIES: hypothetical protein [Methanobacterium]MCZ3366552.1 hypothetical protein [Methanobacterium veterum]MCZ3374304.1 hypothetical protein [Methanobacterium veterum]
MNRPNRASIRQYLDARLIVRVRIFSIISIAMLSLIAFEMLRGTINMSLAIAGILIGLAVSIIVSRMFRLIWDEETKKVIGNMDWIGAVVLIFYISFMLTRTLFLGYYVQGSLFLAIVLSITAGTFIGRVMGTKHGICRVLNTWKIL